MLQSVDSLWNQLAQVRGNFKFRMDEFVERKAMMEKQLIKAQFLDDSKLSEEDRLTFDKYNGVYRVYKHMGGKYKEAVLTAEDIFYALKGLESQVKKNTYNENIEGFKLERDALKKRLAENAILAAEVNEKLTTVEPVFVRTAGKIDEILDSQLPEK